MQSKRERFFQAAEDFPALRCPLCGQAMKSTGNGLACAGGHTRDVNRKGYVHLLNRPHPTCYDQALFEARRQVFEAGCYLPVLEAVEELLPATPQRVLDAGCGEGYYLAGLLSRHPDWQGAGVDISKEAIEKATDWPCRALWCVGDLGRLPFADGAFTAVLDVLTPANYGEFRRALASDGRLIKVYPGTEYLREIREARGITLYQDAEVGEYLAGRCRVEHRRHILARIPVTPALWRAFVWMTPLNQDLTEQEKESLAARPAAQVTLDLHVAQGTILPV